MEKKQPKKAEQTAKTFEGGGLGEDLPEINVSEKEINKGVAFLEFLSNKKITSSKSEARRAIANRGFKINDKVIVDEKKI